MKEDNLSNYRYYSHRRVPSPAEMPKTHNYPSPEKVNGPTNMMEQLEQDSLNSNDEYYDKYHYPHQQQRQVQVLSGSDDDQVFEDKDDESDELNFRQLHTMEQQQKQHQRRNHSPISFKNDNESFHSGQVESVTTSSTAGRLISVEQWNLLVEKVSKGELSSIKLEKK